MDWVKASFKFSLVVGPATGAIVAPAWAAPSLVLVSLVGVALTCFLPLARQDRLAFLSITGPPTTAALLAVLMPMRVALAVDLAAIVWYLAFVFDGTRVATFWWRFVLRRR